MGYHSADYDHDWKIGLAELSRVGFLAGANLDGVVTGCYKIDQTSIDGFARDNNRGINEPVTLSRYHSADYNKDGRIDSNELARVQELYNYRIYDNQAEGYIQTGMYHDNNPFSIDGFGLGTVSISNYSFDSKHKPTIDAKIVPSGSYKLRLKIIDRSSTGFQAATSANNDGLVLDELPAESVYPAELYYIEFDSNGDLLYLADAANVTVTVVQAEEDCRKSQNVCVCGQEEIPIEIRDKGQCFPYREKRSCNTPTIPVAECADTEAYPIFTPGAIPPFYVVARLFDSLCEPITDQDDNPILTIIK